VAVDYWDAHPRPSDDDIREVCEAWVRYQRAPEAEKAADDHPDWWAAEAVIDASDGARRELNWRLVQALTERVDRDDLKTILAIGAGPLESFIELDGQRAIDLIERAVERDRVLLVALAGVWTSEGAIRRRIDECLDTHGQPRL
jgi:hypothetical protein